ncbi:hypothetical protein AWM75_02320 [Aerococcus urinaehominis]|uniref:Uncharacterized protein n=1 Tax=Aerococcus urinaehominis TaxID=128944 RepID=A0A0X8FKC3_9LACT|nr:FGGY family carbohydrate kinase [Aerococcus urinaehominis]AMB98897.1 hypothetical protein AWM75_02320 [Aerococcus urinaehominis]SDM15525.1 gluconokinase [Aerococcus urinaehominis]
MVIVIDLGTSHIKGAVVDSDLHVKYASSQAVDMQAPDELSRTVSPNQVFSAVVTILKDLLAQYPAVKRVIFSAQMHSILVANQSKEVVLAAMTWADNQAITVADLIKNGHYQEDLLQRTGTPVHPMSPLVKLIYLQAAHPFLLGDEANKIMGLKSFVIWRLTDQLVIDVGQASTTGLLRTAKGSWDRDILAVLGISLEKMPQIVGALDKFKIDPVAAQNLGLPTDIEFQLGSSDGALASYALKNNSRRQPVLVSVGTSGAARYLTSEGLKGGNLNLFSYLVGSPSNDYIIGGPVNNAGNVLVWAIDKLADCHDFSACWKQVLSQPLREEGPFFLPYLNGERAPYWNAHLTASFSGLRLNHSKTDMLRAIFEGVFYNLRMVIEQIYCLLDDEAPLIVNSQLARHDIFAQEIANLFGRTIYLDHSNRDASILGAAKLAMEKPDDKFDIGKLKVFHPQTSSQAAYQAKYYAFKKLADQADQAARLEFDEQEGRFEL